MAHLKTATLQEAILPTAAMPWDEVGHDLRTASATDIDGLLRTAGIDWTTGYVPAGGLVGDTWVTDPNTRMVVREDTGRILGPVGLRHTSIPTRDLVESVAFLFQEEELSLVKGGETRGGAIVWLAAQVPEVITLLGDPRETIETYVVLVDHKVTGYIGWLHTDIRPWCANTLPRIEKEAERAYKFRHVRTARERMTEAVVALRRTLGYQKDFASIAEKLLQTTFSNDEWRGLMDQLLPVPEESDEPRGNKGRTQVLNKRDTINQIRNTRENLQHIRETRWGAWNAISDFVDHEQTRRSTRNAQSAENRFERLTGIASSETLTQKAYRLLTAGLKT